MKRVKLLFVLTLALFTSLQSSSTISAKTDLYNMSYLFFGSVGSYVKQVDKTKGSLHVVSPNYFDITNEGQLDVTWKLQTSFISEMHKRGMKVVPFLSNHWNKTAGINALNNRDKLAKDIAAAIEQYNLDGVNVDIEGVGHTYRDAHTDFVRLLRKYIPEHKEVSVAVAANPNGWNTGWHGFYDYNKLGEHSTHLLIMAYDESWESPDSPVGPVSSLSFFERSIQYAINQGVPKDKIVAGLPFYGRMWKLDGPTLEERNITGMGLSSTRVEPLVSQFKGKIQFDQKTQSSFATFTIPVNESTFIGSTKLTEGNYVIWFENEPSIKAKLRLPKQYGIKGTGSWALYHETPDTWDYYTLALNWEDIEKRFESGPMAITMAESLKFMNSSSLNGTVVRNLSKDTLMKVTGDPITSANDEWYPAQLDDGTNGYIAAGSIKRFHYQELYGKDRYDTSVLVANSGWKESSEVVVLGRGDIPIDALTGSVLAIKYRSPLLLTQNNTLPNKVLAELDRLKPKTIYILGGEKAISSSVQSKLEQIGYTVKRIAGQSRYDTSIKVANEIGIRNEFILTSGKDSPDALSVAPYAGIKQIPIVLTQQNMLPNEVKETIKRQKISKVTIIGGEAAISKNVESELNGLGVKIIERVSGKDRFETSIAIAKQYKNELNLSNLYFASGMSFIDALPGSPLAAISNSPIILINNDDELPITVRDFLENAPPSTPDVTIIGGYGVISKTTRANVFKSLK